MNEIHNGVLVSYAPVPPPTETEIAGEELERRQSRLAALEEELRGVRLGQVADRHSPSGRLSDLTPAGRLEVAQAFEAARADRVAQVEQEIERARAAVAEASEQYRRALRSDAAAKVEHAGLDGYPEAVSVLPADAARETIVEVEGRGIIGRWFG